MVEPFTHDEEKEAVAADGAGKLEAVVMMGVVWTERPQELDKLKLGLPS